jgi:hypothetical protein
MAKKVKEAEVNEKVVDSTASDFVVIPPINEDTFGREPLSMSDKGWTKFLLAQLDPDTEMVDGKPTCDGLRRVFSSIFDVLEAAATVIQAPEMENQSRATVQYKIMYRKWDGDGELYVVQDAVDICAANTDIRYARHAVATASTTAESRCYKKALKLVKVLTADEMQAADEGQTTIAEIQESSRPMASSQKTTIIGLCSRLRIDLLAFAKKTLQREVNHVDEMTYGDAQKMIPLLGAYNSGPDSKSGSVIPEDILIK